MRMILRAMGIIVIGIGVMILVTAWTGLPDDAPLVIKLFGSFIALGTITRGFGFIASNPSNPSNLINVFKGHYSRLLDHARDMAESLGQIEKSGESKTDAPPQVSYSCPNCGSDIDERADVSPSGDVKCEYCKRWFNIHQ